MAKLIAVVDDCPEFLPLVEDLLTGDGYRVATAYGQGQVAARLRALRPHLLILDLVLGQGESGWDILEDVRREPDLAATPVILCTADVLGIEARAAALRRHRDVAVLTKPFHIAEMQELVLGLIGRPEAGPPETRLGLVERGSVGRPRSTSARVIPVAYSL